MKGWKVYLLFENGNRFYGSRVFENECEAERVRESVEAVIVGNTETVKIEYGEW